MQAHIILSSKAARVAAHVAFITMQGFTRLAVLAAAHNHAVHRIAKCSTALPRFLMC